MPRSRTTPSKKGPVKDPDAIASISSLDTSEMPLMEQADASDNDLIIPGVDMESAPAPNTVTVEELGAKNSALESGRAMRASDLDQFVSVFCEKLKSRLEQRADRLLKSPLTDTEEAAALALKECGTILADLVADSRTAQGTPTNG